MRLSVHLDHAGPGRYDSIMVHRIETNNLGPLVLDGDRLRYRDGIDPEQWAMEEVRRIVVQAIGPRAIDAYLFGSRARGDVRLLSDADTALDGHGKPLPRPWLAELREALELSLVPFTVEIVDLAAAGPSLRRAVETEGIKWTS